MTAPTDADPISVQGMMRTLGLRLVRASSSEVVLEWDAGPEHSQPMGIVHGGMHCSAIETACSIGATLSARERDASTGAVGLENHTSFVRAVRSGKLTATATPITRGRTSQVWECTVRDEQLRTVATGRVRLLCVGRDAIT
jgi:1,4-dihydroxy-2-naphthoyl-CoA hydrolase